MLLSSALLFALVASPSEATWPAIVTDKNLYATNDFRGKKAPTFVVEKYLNGQMPQTAGKVLVIDFWATWCGPCRELIPEMNKWHAELKNDVFFIGVSDEKEETVRKFMETTPINYLSTIDTQKRMSNALGVKGIPHVMVISSDGIVRWQGWPQDPKDTLTKAKLQQIITANKSLTRN